MRDYSCNSILQVSILLSSRASGEINRIYCQVVRNLAKSQDAVPELPYENAESNCTRRSFQQTQIRGASSFETWR